MKRRLQLLRNACIFPMTEKQRLQVINPGVLVVEGNIIRWVGKETDLPKTLDLTDTTIHDLGGRCITPGFIDCHTHFIYAGERCEEFQWRLAGKTYEEISKNGGGIKKTVQATRQSSFETLYQESAKRLEILIQNGVTTVEVKSGYGLDTETEIRMLKVAQLMEQHYPVRIVKTFLGAHVLPEEYKKKPQSYISFLAYELLPLLHQMQLVDIVDGFCDAIAFNEESLAILFNEAIKLGIPVKCHADQLSYAGGAKLAAKFKALSADHLEYANEQDIQALSLNNVVACLLPGAYYYLQTAQKPPIDLLRKYHVPIAIATDCNPGSSPVLSLLMIMNMAAVLFNLNIDEVLLGVTRHAAQAVGLSKSIGQLSTNFIADLVVWDIQTPAEFIYYMGQIPRHVVMKSGIWHYNKEDKLPWVHP